MSTVEEFAADIRTAPVRGGNDVDLSGPLAYHLEKLGYRKPRQVTTVEELDALPVGTVVRSATGFVWEKDVDDEEPDLAWWSTPSDSRQYPARRIGLPAAVLHVGGAE